MSDDSSVSRGRYAKPRRRAHAEKSMRAQDDGAYGEDEVPNGLFEDNAPEAGADGYQDPYDYEGPSHQADESKPGYEDEGYSRDAFERDEELSAAAGREPAAYREDPHDAADYRPDERQDLHREAPSYEDDYEHDYLERDESHDERGLDPGVQRQALAPEDDFSRAGPERAFASPAVSRDYEDDSYERRPLRDRSLPPPPEDSALVGVGPQADLGEDVNLVVSGIGKSYKRRPVVRDVSLEVRRGEIVGLLGPNGAGKTTCFYMITGLVAADRGAIRLMGRDLTRLPMYQRARMGLSYLPQEVSIFRGMTVEQNIRAILELSEPNRDRREARLDQLLAEFSISRLRNSPAVALSGGERRRVEIARCLAANPSFILLDEPFAGVDPIAVGDIRSLVWQLKDRGIGVLITDHNVRETLEIIDRAYILHDGRVLMEGAPEDVINDENVRRVYLGEGFRV